MAPCNAANLREEQVTNTAFYDAATGSVGVMSGSSALSAGAYRSDSDGSSDGGMGMDGAD